MAVWSRHDLVPVLSSGYRIDENALAAPRPHAAHIAAHVQHSRPANGLPARASPDRQRPGGTRAKRGPKPIVNGVLALKERGVGSFVVVGLWSILFGHQRSTTNHQPNRTFWVCSSGAPPPRRNRRVRRRGRRCRRAGAHPFVGTGGGSERGRGRPSLTLRAMSRASGMSARHPE